MSNLLTEIALSDIMISERNPRKTFDEAALQELSVSIKIQGVLAPVLCRALYTGKDGGVIYELVAGERRVRASKMAGLEMIPAQVKFDMSDDEAFEAMIMENLDRREVHPIEEAEAFKLMLDSGRYTIADIAAKVAKTEQFITQRLSINNLVDEIKQDFYHGELAIGHAVLIARLPESAQAEILKGYKNNQVKGYGSIKQLQKEIADEALDLHQAIFSLETDFKCAAACAVCPKRSSNSPTLFPEMEGEDNCMDKACFRAKVNEHIAQKMQEIVDTESNTLFGITYSENLSPELAKIAEKLDRKVFRLYDDFQSYERTNHAPAELLYLTGKDKGQVVTVWIQVAKKKTQESLPPKLANNAEEARLKQRAVRDLQLDEEKIHVAVKEAVEKKLKPGTKPRIEYATPDFFEAMFLYIAIDTYPLWSFKHDAPKYGLKLKGEYRDVDEMVEDILKLDHEQRKLVLALLLNKKCRQSTDGSSLHGRIMRQLAKALCLELEDIEAPFRAKAAERIARVNLKLEKLN